MFCDFLGINYYSMGEIPSLHTLGSVSDAVIAALTFFVPYISCGAKLAYAYFMYIAWDLIYTAGDTPTWALTSVITRDTRERTGIITMAGVFSIFGMAVPAIANDFFRNYQFSCYLPAINTGVLCNL